MTVEDESRIESWLANVPELATRERLVAFLRAHKPLRTALFNTVNVLENIALIPDPAVASEVLTSYWQHIRWRFETYWKGRLSADVHEEHQLWAELHGTLRNVFKNMLVKVGKLHPGFSKKDVQRVYERALYFDRRNCGPTKTGDRHVPGDKSVTRDGGTGSEN